MTRFILLLSLIFPAIAQAETNPPVYDRVNLTATASQSIDNDTLVAVLYLQREGNNTAKLANEVNQGISQAIKHIKQTPGIKVQTLEYNTNPIYNKQRINGWRVRQSLRLESRDSTRLSELIGSLQEQLSIGQIHYQLSTEQRQLAEQRLISAAIANFKARAQLISEQMQSKSYRLVQMSINSSGTYPRPSRANGMPAMEMRSVAAPAIEAGSQKVQVSINGTIELIN